MKRLSKVILFSFSVLVVLFVTGLFVLGVCLSSPGGRAQIEEAMSDALGTPIRITSVSMKPGSDLEITGITVRSLENAGGDFITAEKFTADYELFPILGKKLVIPKMVLIQPVMVWPKNSEGRWAWPKSEREKKKSDRKKKKGLEGKSESGFEVVIRALEIRDARITLLDDEQKPTITGEAVTVLFSRFEADALAGSISAGRVTWAGILPGENVSSTFWYQDGSLSMPDVKAGIAGGTMTGSFKLATEKDGAPMTLTLTIGDISLGQLSATNGWAESGVAGKLSGEVELSGNSREFAKSKGRASIEIKDGHFEKLDLFQTIGQVLAIDELANLKLSEAKAKLRIADEKAFVESLVLASPDLRITAKGVARFDKNLKLNATLGIRENLADRLPKFVLANFSSPDDKSMRSIEFEISGKTDKPKTDLAEKLIGRNIGNQVTDLISGLFGKKKDKDREKEEKERKEKEQRDQAQQGRGPSGSLPRPPSPTPVRPIAPSPPQRATPNPDGAVSRIEPVRPPEAVSRIETVPPVPK